MIRDIPFGKVTEPLLSWFHENKRTLPWREDPSPYRVWISEIMLQQTRVEAVKPYFERFVKELPGIEELSSCEEERLLKLWEGLGYYSRARALRKAALRITEEYGGKMPEEYEELLELPGIGPYTAGAISSIAFGKRSAAVDGNVFRIMTRIGADDSDITKTAFRKEITELLCEVMPEGESGAFNQALMELGATVCVPNGDPKCEECPLKEICLAHRDSSETAYPVKPEKKKRRIEDKTVFLIRDGERIVLRKRPEKGLLAGMYEFPNVPGHLSQKEAVKKAEAYGFIPLRVEPLESAKHIFSHVEWHMTGYLISIASTEKIPEGLIFVNREETDRSYPVPAAYAAYRKYMR